MHILNKLLRSYLGNGFFKILDLLYIDHDLKRNKKLKGKFQNKRIFILGSGPSIKKYNLELLKDEYVMTQNSFHMHEKIKLIKPDFHCLIPYYQSEKEEHKWVEWIEEMKIVMPETKYFIGKNTKKLIEKYHNDLLKQTYFFKSNYNVLTLNKAKFDLTKNIMAIPTVITLCLLSAIYLGFSEIILLGFDLDQICKGQDPNFGRFYGKSKITDTDKEREIEKNQAVITAEGWYNRWLMNKQLILIRELSDKINVKIINGNDSGLIDCYTREPIENYIKGIIKNS